MPATGSDFRARAGRLAAIALAFCATAFALPVRADYTARLQLGNWAGGIWVDNATREFRNCGLTIGFSGGTSLAVIVPASLAPVLMIIDPRIQAQPQQAIQARLKFGAGPELALNATALQPTMIQIPMPALPHHYDQMRNAPQLAIAVPGLTAQMPIDGIAKVLPQMFDCALRERVKLAKPPELAVPGVPFGRIEVMLAGLAIAERSGIGPYIVFEDGKRPGNMQGAAVVTGFAGAQGPGGPANILSTAYFLGPEIGATAQDAKAAITQRIRQADPKAVIGELPAIPGKAASFGLSSLGNGVYEEIYMVQKPGAGFFQFTTSTPEAGRKTAEAAGVKFRQAISLVVPY